MIRRARALWRRARSARMLRPVLAAVDRTWWARTIRRADIVDPDFVAAQGFRSPAQALRAYVRGGFRAGVSLNPLFAERLVSGQLADSSRVPALYAYLIGDDRRIRVSAAWDAPAHAAKHSAAAADPAGPLGHAWRRARAGSMDLKGMHGQSSLSWQRVTERLVTLLDDEFEGDEDTRASAAVVIWRIDSAERASTASLEIARELADESSAALVIAVTGRSAEAWSEAALLSLSLDRATVVRDEPGLVDRVSSTLPEGTVVMVREPGSEIGVRAARELLRRGEHEAVAPLWLALDGTIAAAGTVAHRGRLHPLLAGHPAEDAGMLGDEIVTLATAAPVSARPVGAPESPARTLLGLIVRAPWTPPLDAATDEVDTDLDALLAPGGLRLDRHVTTSDSRLFRPPRSVTLADGEVVPSLRWALKIVAPPGSAGEAWGDTHFARGLADALRRLGQEVVIDAYDARHRPSSHLDDVVLALRGPEPFRAQPGARSMMWIISHPNEVTSAELAGFDHVFAASAAWAATSSRRFGRPVVPLLQCTDPLRFHPQGLPRTRGLVFVGTARGIPRPSVIEPLRAGLEVEVHGPDWRGWIPARAIASTGIANSELPGLYESADAVLNDHWPAMREEGFVSNRLFDVVAAGGRAISDSVAGIAALFSGAVQEYRDVPELLDMLRRPLDDVFPDDDGLAAISARVRQEHSFDARARTLLDAALDAGLESAQPG